MCFKMFFDFVKCNNCGAENMHLPLGEEVCPECKAVGTMSWMDEEEPEIEI